MHSYKRDKPVMDVKGTSDRTHDFSRREFITGAGAMLGGTALGSGLLLSACNPPRTETVIVNTIKSRFVCPYDARAFDTFEELAAYIDESFPEKPPITKFTCPYDDMEFSTLTELKAHLDNLFLDSRFITIEINGKEYGLKVQDNWSLAFVLREKLGLTGTKIGCDRGSCGACTVVVDGKAIYSCMMLAIEAAGKHIKSIEALSDGVNLHRIQQAFIDGDAVQCGYCTPGFIMSAVALLDSKPNPTRDDVREALSGHLCICGHTKKIVDAVLRATEKYQ
jgi:carbon-monoxide dehydrogenase small subunit